MGSAPRSRLDDQGWHIGVCIFSGPAASPSRRHDTLCRSLAVLSRQCGRGGYYHNGPVFSAGSRYRPADWMEEGTSTAPGGVLCDATIVHGGYVEAVAAENRKVAHYAPQMARHEGLAFLPFAISADGAVGPGAARCMASWTAALAALRLERGYPVGSPWADVATSVARAFADALAAQLEAWLQPRPGLARRFRG